MLVKTKVTLTGSMCKSPLISLTLKNNYAIKSSLRASPGLFLGLEVSKVGCSEGAECVGSRCGGNSLYREPSLSSWKVCCLRNCSNRGLGSFVLLRKTRARLILLSKRKVDIETIRLELQESRYPVGAIYFLH